MPGGRPLGSKDKVPRRRHCPSRRQSYNDVLREYQGPIQPRPKLIKRERPSRYTSIPRWERVQQARQILAGLLETATTPAEAADLQTIDALLKIRPPRNSKPRGVPP